MFWVCGLNIFFRCYSRSHFEMFLVFWFRFKRVLDFKNRVLEVVLKPSWTFFNSRIHRKLLKLVITFKWLLLLIQSSQMPLKIQLNQSKLNKSYFGIAHSGEQLEDYYTSLHVGIKISPNPKSIILNKKNSLVFLAMSISCM